MTSCTSPVVNFQEQFSISDVGRLYKIPKEEVEALGYKRMLPRFLARQYDTLDELVTMIREPLDESAIAPFATGKSVTLNQAVHLAYTKKMVVIQLWSAMLLTRDVNEVEMSTFKQGRINDPANAVAILQQQKRDYVWTRNERTAVDKPITDIVEILFVAIDDTNSLWGRLWSKKLTGAMSFRSVIPFFKQNGCILLVADKKEVSDARDHVTVPRHTPLELFGEEGFHFIEPFLPIETKQYTKGEVSNMYQYYYDKRWLTTENGMFRSN
ncbi:hypothetical protein OSTOST_21280 [Ostertagia ostertagi]